MRDLIANIFGTYTPPTNVTYVVVDGVTQTVNVIPAGVAGVDWQWLAGVGLFAIVLYCLLRMVGVLLGK